MTPAKLKKLLDEHFTTASGRLNTQALTEKGFKKRGLECFHEFEILNLTTAQKIYDFVNNTNSKCSQCDNDKRFKGYQHGYTEFCEPCGRSINNASKRHRDGTFDTLDDIRDKRGMFSSSKIKKLSSDSIQRIKNMAPHIKNSEYFLSEHLYCIEHNIKSYPECVVCGSEHNRFIPNVGYKDTCSSDCKWKIVDHSARKRTQRLNFYQKYVERYSEFDDDYEVKLFTKEDYINKKECVISFKHKKCGHKFSLGLTYQGSEHCPKCFPIRSKQQYLIYDDLSKRTKCEMNNRQLISPKEIDIVSHEHLFGIEYDSIMYHSFGKYGPSWLNNYKSESMLKYHSLDKHNDLEKLNYQLFRIFSSEWLNETKQSIWKSVIASKIGSTNRLYARKCQIHEVDSKTSKQFLEENHLQGNVNAKYRYGLYFENELVSLMTFGKTRRAKWKGDNNYELLRFCTKLNFTVVGGASRLLKYFEKINEPDMVLSYANRRWSTGNLYEKLDFEFIENTKPNYFYFKGSDGAVLLSREQFQKHKLKDKLETFDESLTETENMYNDDYRKIYDSGHKIYVKNYK